MPQDQPPARRLTLRQLLAQAEKCSRDLVDQLHSSLLTQLNECRELSRPIRRRSSYPSVLAVMNALQHLKETENETEVLTEYLLEQLEEIRQHAQRERIRH